MFKSQIFEVDMLRDKTVECTICGRFYVDESARVRHAIRVHGIHPPPGEFECPWCPKRFNTLSKLQIHWGKEHKHVKPIHEPRFGYGPHLLRKYYPLEAEFQRDKEERRKEYDRIRHSGSYVPVGETNKYCPYDNLYDYRYWNPQVSRPPRRRGNSGRFVSNKFELERGLKKERHPVRELMLREKRERIEASENQ